ncbi:hypothetical protein [Kitasatospora sp. NPDC008115]|uniref:hypothetical protein n=1 Tax=Kitasatospora sp. NPDC008115 TaxID=3364022 RepID=UPI0036EF276F
MRRLAVAVAVGVLTVAVAVTGCGSVRVTEAGGGGGGGGTVAETTVPAEPDPATDPVRQGVADHDRLFPGVAALGCASAKPSPSAGGTGTTAPAVPADPWAARHAENSMYKQMAPLNAVDRCRGEAHSRRISDVVKARAALGPLTGDDVHGILESLGYPRNSAQVQLAGGQVSFELTIPGAGPCVGGRVAGGSVSVEAHGNYLDGGCSEPKGGH